MMDQLTDKQADFRAELLRQLSRAVETRDVVGGLRLVEKTRQLMADSNDSVAGHYYLLLARLHFLGHEYQKALSAARLAISILTHLGETEDLAEAFLVSGKALVNQGNYRDSETAFFDAESLFRRNENVQGQIDALNHLARVHFIRSEYKSALKHLLVAVKLAEAVGDRQKMAYIWGNIGRVYTLMGNFKKGAETLSLNATLSAELKDAGEEAKALMSLGYIETESEEFDQARQHLDQAYIILLREKMTRDIIICQTYLGQLMLRCGDFGGARRHLDDAVDGARRLASKSSLLVMPLRLLAELEMAADNYNLTFRLANQALALADEIGEVVEKGICLRTLARLALKRQEGEKKAEDLFRQAMEIFVEVDARYERAETMVMMAEGQIGTWRQRLASLFSAADLYQRLGVSIRHEKTQRLINQFEMSGQPELDRPVASNADPVIITVSARMKIILDQLDQAARSDLPILLIGETGTGKDLLARYYHAHTGRQGHFVAANCAAFPDTLFEAEFFGYRRGAFTGAGADKEGLLHRANGGTFFLDEIGEMSPIAQAKLLNVIETCRARRLGDTVEEKLDVRFIAATNCDLAAMVEQGTFRRDLYYRLSGICFHLPSLSERPEDIPALVQYFLEREGVIGSEAAVNPLLIREFTSRAWPGNVRQLESEVKKLVLLAQIAREDSLGELAGVLVQNDCDSETTSLVDQVEQFERGLIIKALRLADGNKSRAARSLSVHESTLRAKMKRYALDQVETS